MAHHARSASARPEIPLEQQAIALIGAKLIAFRINRHPEQLAQLIGMSRMAAQLGAISNAEHIQLLEDLYALADEEVSHG
ncbi:hypothetical protein [Kushneria phosphatilytica]|uniref:Uncharacterized protein n=1 Tax=Kushneria phosphatilytica TaxID=657387 RepID=A0A5C1A421_9GAMM|nr:hypothetical protein [Kushneria phosphatilytica]QEL11685.1 hypothetical protein FY550_11415 [Kushneria phosphatilytica]